MTEQEVLDQIAALGESSSGMTLFVKLAMMWGKLAKLPAEKVAFAAALYALHLKATRSQSAQVLTEREGDLSRTYANTQGQDPLGWSFWGRMLKDLLEAEGQTTEYHIPGFLASPYTEEGDDCGCNR
jgi:hypothetical protein|nr:MAG TPA: Protein of unknown function (DUF4054) [Caudoviricetes sp.]